MNAAAVPTPEFNDLILAWDGTATRTPSEPFDFAAHGEQLPALVGRMRNTMLRANGVGLSACQIGIMWQVCLVALPERPELLLVNPELLASEGKQRGFEGCLSVPHARAIVERPQKIKVAYWLGVDDRHELEAEGLAARCILHELDHVLYGKYFIDRLGKLQQEIIRRKHLKWMAS